MNSTTLVQNLQQPLSSAPSGVRPASADSADTDATKANASCNAITASMGVDDASMCLCDSESSSPRQVKNTFKLATVIQPLRDPDKALTLFRQSHPALAMPGRPRQFVTIAPPNASSPSQQCDTVACLRDRKRPRLTNSDLLASAPAKGPPHESGDFCMATAAVPRTRHPNTAAQANSLVIQWNNVFTLSPFGNDFTMLVQRCHVTIDYSSSEASVETYSRSGTSISTGLSRIANVDGTQNESLITRTSPSPLLGLARDITTFLSGLNTAITRLKHNIEMAHKPAIPEDSDAALAIIKPARRPGLGTPVTLLLTSHNAIIKMLPDSRNTSTTGASQDATILSDTPRSYVRTERFVDPRPPGTDEQQPNVPSPPSSQQGMQAPAELHNDMAAWKLLSDPTLALASDDTMVYPCDWEGSIEVSPHSKPAPSMPINSRPLIKQEPNFLFNKPGSALNHEEQYTIENGARGDGLQDKLHLAMHNSRHPVPSANSNQTLTMRSDTSIVTPLPHSLQTPDERFQHSLPARSARPQLSSCEGIPPGASTTLNSNHGATPTLSQCKVSTRTYQTLMPDQMIPLTSAQTTGRVPQPGLRL
jgi:hypothetical protein